ncbi:MAG: hypothetical protein WDM78_03550 [Puia sp.]
MVYRFTDAVKGEIFEPLTIVPGQMAYCDPDLLVFTDGKEKELMVKKQLKTLQDEDGDNSVIHPAVLSTGKNPPSVDRPFQLLPFLVSRQKISLIRVVKMNFF